MPRVVVKPEYSRTKVDSAGRVLTSGDGAFSRVERSEALVVIGNWRSAHSYPLNAFTVTLRGRAQNVDSDALVAQRLKRLSSIDAKLRRFDTMTLSQMQDIGGCRAVLSSVYQVEELAKVYERADAKNPHRGAEWVKTKDYLRRPKADGYRGIHMMYRYRSRSPHNAVWNGLRIEIQMRSALQHAWATAVETVSTFTKQQLKANIGQEDWKRFFALMGTAIAIREDRPTVPNTPGSRMLLVEQLRELVEDLHVEGILTGWQTAVRIISDEKPRDARFFLLVLDSEAGTITISAYDAREEARASAEYLEVEKRIAENPALNAVLASVESITALQRAFPNYYLDTAAFRSALTEALNLW